jgi:NADH:ubiquinone oxidoreductase subunit 4 (subunit M)
VEVNCIKFKLLPREIRIVKLADLTIIDILIVVVVIFGVMPRLCRYVMNNKIENGAAFF